MALLCGTAKVVGVTTGVSALTLVQIVAPSNHRLGVEEVSVSFNGAAGTSIRVDIMKQTTAGTSSSLTVVKLTPGSETLQATALQTFTAEPTAGDILHTEYVPPNSGWTMTRSLLNLLQVAGGERLGVRVTAPSSCSANASIKYWE